MPTTIAFLNRKGGVGKTSSCHHLAGSLAKAGYKVLIVDNDPQCSLTQGLMGIKAVDSFPGSATILACYQGDARSVDEIAVPTGLERVSLLAGSEELEGYDLKEPHKLPRRDQIALSEALAETSADFTLIDCPPTLRGCAWAALASADALVVPLQPEDYGSQGIVRVQAFLGRAREHVNPNLELAGYLLTMVSKSSLHSLYERQLREAYGTQVFAAVVPRAVALAESISMRLPICRHAPRSAASRAIDAVATELVARVVGEGVAA